MDESVIKKILADPRSKVKRAKRHLDTLVQQTSVVPKDLYVITNGPAYSCRALAEPDCFKLRLIPKEPIPEHCKAIIGDVINNLREALDFFMTRVMRAGGSNSKVHFPFSQKWEELPSTAYWNKIERVAPNTAEFIKTSIRPAEDADSDLWRLNKLCVLNKHNDFAPSIAKMTIKFNILTGRRAAAEATVEFESDDEAFIVTSNTKISIKNDAIVTCNVTFTEGSYFSGQPVIPTLLNLQKAVSETLNALEVFLRETELL